MKDLRWRGVVTDRGHFIADEHKAFVALMRSMVGDEVEVVVTSRRPQSPKKRGLLHGLFKREFHRWLTERFREEYGAFTFDEAYELLVRLVLNRWEDEERASTSIEAMDDAQYGEFLFRAEGFLASIGVDLSDAERDPAVRNEREMRRTA